MPVKWNADMDQTLLIKILETSNVSADVKAISAAWPAEKCDGQGNPPTPRAISERLVKIRSAVKANGAGHFAVTSGQTKTPKKSNAPATPGRGRGRPPKNPKTPSSPETSFTAVSKQSTVAPSELSNGELGGSSQSSQGSFGDDFGMPPTPMSVSTPGSKRKRGGVKIKDEFDGVNGGSGGFDDDFEMSTPSKKPKNFEGIYGDFGMESNEEEDKVVA